MRVISIKNYCDNIRVIIQLMQYHNKVSAKISIVKITEGMKVCVKRSSR